MLLFSQIEIDFDSILKSKSEEKKPSKKINWYLREIIAVIFHLYAFTQLWVYNIDQIVKYLLPNSFKWLPDFKFLIFAFIILLAWAIGGNKKFFLTMLYISCYPFILLLWRLPIFLVKKIRYTIFFMPLIPSLSQYKLKLYIIFLFLTSLAIIRFSNNIYLLYGCIAFFTIFILYHYFSRIYTAFFPKTLFDHATNLLQKYLPKICAQLMKRTKNVEVIETSTDELAKQRLNQLVGLYALNRCFVFIARIVNYFKERKLVLLYSFISLLATFTLTIIIFTLIYYTLNKINPSHFVGENKSVYMFVLLSINTILSIDYYQVFSINGIPPALAITFEYLLGYVFLVVIAAILIAVFIERNNNKLTEIIDQFDKQSKEIENEINNRYQITILQVELEYITRYPEVLKHLKRFELLMNDIEDINKMVEDHTEKNDNIDAEGDNHNEGK